jgi:hypothetical protein
MKRNEFDLIAEQYTKVGTLTEGDGSWMDDLEGGRHKDMDPHVDQDSHGDEDRLKLAIKLQDSISTSLTRLANLQQAAAQSGSHKTKQSIANFWPNLKESINALEG